MSISRRPGGCLLYTSLSFDADGIAKGVDWLNEQIEGQKARWKAVSRG